MVVLICGGRDYDDWYQMGELIWLLHERGMRGLVHGDARGADRMAGAIYKELLFLTESADRRWIVTMPADWEKYGIGAGPIRNATMLGEFKPDLVVAVKGGRGTANMVMQAMTRGVPVKQYGEDAFQP